MILLGKIHQDEKQDVEEPNLRNSTRTQSKNPQKKELIFNQSIKSQLIPTPKKIDSLKSYVMNTTEIIINRLSKIYQSCKKKIRSKTF